MRPLTLLGFGLVAGLLVAAPTLAQAMDMPMPMAAQTPSTLSSSAAEVASSSTTDTASAEPAPPTEPVDIYAHTRANDLSPAVADALPRVYVPNRVSGTVSVIDPATLKVVGHYRVGFSPQHVVPAWDLKTLYVTSDGNGYPHRGSLTPIDPKTGRPGRRIAVDDPYNMYFLPDGSAAIIVAEEYRRLDFRDPHTFALLYSIAVPGCPGINHADFSADASYAIFTCEFGGSVAKIDLKSRSVVGYLQLSADGMPQDIRLSPDGTTFYVADMMNDGVYAVDGESFTKTGFIPTGIGAHGFVVSRDGTKLVVSNRGTHSTQGDGHNGPGSVSTIDCAPRPVSATWYIPGGCSPDMGNVSADGTALWYSGRFDNLVYRFDTATGAVTRIRVGTEPHGLAVWPQPGRYSLGHTGNMR
jgi:YVTN family beta-propeller protein